MADRLDPTTDRTTEFLLAYLGPPQVGDVTAPHRPVSEAEAARDAALRTGYVRRVGADGRSFLVARGPADETGDAAADGTGSTATTRATTRATT